MPCFHRKETATPDESRLPVIFSSLRAAHNRQLDQLDAAARKLLLDTYRRLKPELVAKLRALDAEGKGTTFEAQHLALIKLEVEEALAAWAPTAAEALTALTTQTVTFGATTAIAEIAELEKRFADAEQAARVEALPPTIPADQVARIADDQKLLLRKFADEAVNGTVRDEAQLPGIADKLAESVALGESIPKAAKRLGQALDAEAYKLKRIARTEIANAANASHEAQIEAVAIAFPEMGLKKQWSAETCSPRTCPVCQDLDGQVVGYNDDFVYVDGKVEWRGKASPQHPNCRCRVNAYRAEWAVKPAKAPPKMNPRRRRKKEGRMAVKSAPGREVKNLPLVEFKMLDEEAGTFTGYAAAYGNVDSYGDVIQPGAFKDWLAAAQRAGKKIPILWQHDTEEPIGVCDPADLEEDAKGLRVKKATLVLSVQRAAEARDLMLAGAIDSLSIGYSVDEKAQPPKGNPARRFLVKLTLWEFSPVTFPANNQASITGAKGRKPAAVKAADFAATLELNQREQNLWERRWAIADALGQVLRGALCDENLSRDDALTLVETSLEQYSEAMLAWFSDALDLAQAEREANQKDGAGPDEIKVGPAATKAGKKLSAATVKAIDEAMACYDKGAELHTQARKKLADLIGATDDEDDEEPKGAAPPSAPELTPELKDFHAFLAEFQTSLAISEMKRAL